jgi:hypothetical protein
MRRDAVTLTGVEWPTEQPAVLAVTIGSSRRVRAAVECIAQCFRREMGFDFVQYEVSPESDDERDVAFVFLEEFECRRSDLVIGAASFRWRGDHTALQWVWVHPYRRGRGVLRAAWPMLCERFPWFRVEEPVSEAMWRFLRRAGTDLTNNNQGGRR